MEMADNAITKRLNEELTSAVLYRDSLYAMDINEDSKQYLIGIQNNYIKSLEKQINERNS